MSTPAQTAAWPADEVVAAMRAGTPASAELVNHYYTLCIPFYREFLGEHWHTGFYLPRGQTGPQDQLRMERLIAQSAGLVEGCEVLDVGCGIGGTACHLALTTGATFRGLTPNPTQLAIARDAAGRRRLERRVAFDLGEAGRLPYADGSFDVVTFFESACHFQDRGRFFSEAWRVLRPGGRLAGEDWLECEGMQAAQRVPWIDRVCSTWAIPSLGTVTGYAAGMSGAGFDEVLARDMREEMDVSRGFIAQPEDRRSVAREMQQTQDPIRRMIMEGLLALGEAVQVGAFTIGRFVARKPLPP